MRDGSGPQSKLCRRSLSLDDRRASVTSMVADCCRTVLECAETSKLQSACKLSADKHLLWAYPAKGMAPLDALLSCAVNVFAPGFFGRGA